MRHFLTVAVLGLVFALLGVVQAAPPKWTVILPDTGTYAYWVQSKSGTVAALPVTVAHKATVSFSADANTGDTLYVLDAHTGQVAAHTLTASGSVTLAVADFKPLPAPNAPVEPASKAPLPTAPVPAHEAAANPIGVFFSWIFGLAVAAGVVWFVLKLVKTRGEPLIALARRVGVDVPDPKPIDPNAEAPLPLYEAPKPRVVEKIPEEAGVAAPVRGPSAASVRKLAAPTGAPQLVGTQGLAAGSTFALNDGSVMIGRDGDNEIVLAETTVSRRHARIVRDDGGQITITDQGSANGVYINGERVQQATLAHGDELKIGDNFFRFEA